MRPGVNVPYTDADRRYWRARGNRRVRKRRLARHTIRWTALVLVHAIVVGVLLFAANRAVRHATRSGEFALETVRIDGLARVADAEIHRAVRPFLGRNVLDLDLTEVAREIERQPWIRTAVVRRVLPRDLAIAVEERVPVARVVIDGATEMVDADGTVLPPRDTDFGDGLPWISGVDADDPPGLAGAVRGALRCLGDLHAARPEWYAEIDAVEPVDGTTLGIVLRDGDRLLVDARDPARNLDAWIALRSEIGRRVGATDYVDLRWRGRVTVLPASWRTTEHTTNRPGRIRSGR